MENLIFYPTLTEDMLDNAGFKTDKYIFAYTSNGNEYGLKQKGSSTIKLSDPLELWDIERDGITLKKRVSFAYPDQLFGKKGVACHEAEIGICIIWTNHELTQTGCILPEKDVSTPSGRICDFSYTFAPGDIKGDLDLSVCSYIKKSACNILPGEEILMNEEGVSVGELESVVLDFNSVFMDFPIEEYSSDKEPLWWIEFQQWEDPRSVDMFTKENVCLYLNPYYSACPMTDGTIKNVDLMIDILASAYFMMFDRLSDEELRATRQNIGLAPNSICSILNYFIGTCNDPELRFDSPEALMKTLQMNIRKKLTEGDE